MPRKSSAKPGPPRGRVRIIGGIWRGRKLNFSARADLRPTPDRIRETLFNWLQPVIAGAHCLDLFAGSGALGLESLSRGAAQAVMVERDPWVCREIQTHIERFAAERGRVITADALSYLRGSARCFGIVFLDPPFESGLLGSCCNYLEERGWLAPGAYIYLEARGRGSLPPLPATWNLLHGKRAGEVGYYLARKDLNTLGMPIE